MGAHTATPASRAATHATAGADHATSALRAKVPAGYIPPWERDPPAQQPTAAAPSSSSGEAYPQQPQPVGEHATHQSGQGKPLNQAATEQQPGGNNIPPTAELEEEEPAGGTSGGGKPQRPYHEGHGDQRMRGKRFKAAVQQAFGQRGWTKGEDVTWKDVAHLVGLKEEDSESTGNDTAFTATTAEANHASSDSRRRPGGPQATQSAPPAEATTAEMPEEEGEDALYWDGLFSNMLISPGGADRPTTFPPELPIHADAEMHLRSLPHGAWAGITLPWRSRRAPEYVSTSRGFCRVRVRRQRGGREPAGYMGTSTSFVLFPWGGVKGGRPRKWLLHITGGPPTPDPDATQLQPGTSFSLEMPPGAPTWQLGRLQPRLALQYYYDWGHMMGTGAIYDRLPRASNNPPTAWEQMALQLIPPPNRMREAAPNPTFRGENHSETPSPGAAPSAGPSPATSPLSPSPAPAQPAGDHNDPEEDDDDGYSFMQSSTQLDASASSDGGTAGRQQGRPTTMLTAAAMVRHWLRELAAVLRSQPMGDDIPILLEQPLQMVGTNRENDAHQDNGTVGGPGPCKKRRVLNTLELARMRLEDLCDEDGGKRPLPACGLG